MAHHRIYLDGAAGGGAWRHGEVVEIAGEEARHALRVKRVEPGEEVELLDGRGTVAEGTLEPGAGRGREPTVRVRVAHVRRAEPVRPRVEVWSATPKGSRVDEMIDGLSQAGAASWGALETERGVVEPRPAKMTRLGRIALEASKQCGRAWVMVVHDASRGLDHALAPMERGVVVVADASGGPYRRTGAGAIRLLVGPEGGWVAGELARARAAGALVAGFGPHAMRIETAAVVAAGVILAVEGGAL